MNLSELIRNGDFSTLQQSNYPSFYNYYDTFSEYIYENSISDEHHNRVEESGRVKKYIIREWLCTDTHVGVYLYVVDGIPACVMSQTGRKSYPDWIFVSPEGFDVTKQLFDDYAEPFVYRVQLPLLEEDDLRWLNVDPQLSQSNVTNKDILISSIVVYEDTMQMLTKENLRPDVRDLIHELVDIHEDFCLEILNEYGGESAEYQYMISRSASAYKIAKDLLNG